MQAGGIQRYNDCTALHNCTVIELFCCFNYLPVRGAPRRLARLIISFNFIRSLSLLFSKVVPHHASEGKEDRDPPLYVQAVRLAEGDGLGWPEHQGNWSGWCGVPVGPFLDKAAESIA